MPTNRQREQQNWRLRKGLIIASSNNLRGMLSHVVPTSYDNLISELDNIEAILLNANDERAKRAGVRVQKEECPTCRSLNFNISKLGTDRCTFCDGTLEDL